MVSRGGMTLLLGIVTAGIFFIFSTNRELIQSVKENINVKSSGDIKPTPGTLALSVSPKIMPGEYFDITVTGLQPSEKVNFYFGMEGYLFARDYDEDTYSGSRIFTPTSGGEIQTSIGVGNSIGQATTRMVAPTTMSGNAYVIAIGVETKRKTEKIIKIG